MDVFINRAMIILAAAIVVVLMPQPCFGRIFYYSKENTTFARTIDDLNTHEFCGYALAPRFTRLGLKVASLSEDLRQRLRTFYERHTKMQKKPEPLNDFIWRNQTENANSTFTSLLSGGNTIVSCLSCVL